MQSKQRQFDVNNGQSSIGNKLYTVAGLKSNNHWPFCEKNILISCLQLNKSRNFVKKSSRLVRSKTPKRIQIRLAHVIEVRSPVQHADWLEGEAGSFLRVLERSNSGFLPKLQFLLN